MKNSREKMKNSKGNYNISDEKKFCENEILEKLLAKMKKLREDFEEMKNEINELKSNNNNTNNTLINNIDKPLNELKSEEKVDDHAIVFECLARCELFFIQFHVCHDSTTC
jgi:site-specific DNA-adenine methylase